MTTTAATDTETAAPPGATPKLNKALSQLQGELPKVKKTKTGKVEGENKAGKYFSYEYCVSPAAGGRGTARPDQRHRGGHRAHRRADRQTPGRHLTRRPGIPVTKPLGA